MKSLDQIRQNGAKSHDAGVRLDRNPHDRHDDPAAYWAWHDGWTNACIEGQAKERV